MAFIAFPTLYAPWARPDLPRRLDLSKPINHEIYERPNLRRWEHRHSWTSKVPKRMAHIPFMLGIEATILGTSEVQAKNLVSSQLLFSLKLRDTAQAAQAYKLKRLRVVTAKVSVPWDSKYPKVGHIYIHWAPK